MRTGLLISLIFLLLVSCSKSKDNCTEDPQRVVESFSGTTFKRYGTGYTFDDMLLTNQNEIIVAGLNSQAFVNSRLPFISLLNDQFANVWEQTFMLEQSFLHKKVGMVSTHQGNLLLCSYSVPNDGSKIALELIEYDRAGISQWRSTIKSISKNLRPTSIINIPNGEFVIMSSETLLDTPDISEFQLTRVASNGDEIWTKSIPTESLYLPTHLINCSSNTSIFTISEHFTHRDNGAEVHVHKLDYDANLLWKKTIVVNGRLWPAVSNITPIADGDILISFSSLIVGKDMGRIFLIRMDKSGNIQWEKSIESCGSNVARHLLPTNDGNLIMLSNSTSFGAGGFDIMVTKLDSSGNVLWEKVYGGKLSDQGHKILERPNGNFIILANTNEGTASELVFEGLIFEIDKDGFPL